MAACMKEVITHFPNVEFDYDNLSRHVRRIVARFRQTGSVDKGKSPGRSSVSDEDTVDDIWIRIEHSPHKSLRKLSQQTGLSYGTCQKAVKRKLHLHPYKISLMQELLPPDFEKLVQ